MQQKRIRANKQHKPSALGGACLPCEEKQLMAVVIGVFDTLVLPVYLNQVSNLGLTSYSAIVALKLPSGCDRSVEFGLSINWYQYSQHTSVYQPELAMLLLNCSFHI